MNWKIKTRRVSLRSICGFTIPAKAIRQAGAHDGDYVKLTINKDGNKASYYIRISKMCPSRTNRQVRRAIPKEIVEKFRIKSGDEIILTDIQLVKNTKSDILFHKGKLDILACIPESNKRGIPLMVDKFFRGRREWCRIWYCAGHGSKLHGMELKRFIKIDRVLGEFFGLMQAESRKFGSKFDFTNNLVSEHELFIRVAERFGIKRNLWKYEIFYNPRMKRGYVQGQIKSIRRRLNIEKSAFTKNVGLTKTAICIYINNSILCRIMNNTLVKIRSEIIMSKNIDEIKAREFSVGFLCKVLLGDGNVTYNKANKYLAVVIYEENKNSQNDIVNMFKCFGINSTTFRNRICLSDNLQTKMWLLNKKAFEGHENRKRLIRNIRKKNYFRHFYSRFKTHDRYTKEQFSMEHNLSIGTSVMYLYRNTKRGFLIRNGDSYELSGVGRRMVETLKNAEGELTLLEHP